MSQSPAPEALTGSLALQPVNVIHWTCKGPAGSQCMPFSRLHCLVLRMQSMPFISGAAAKGSLLCPAPATALVDAPQSASREPWQLEQHARGSRALAFSGSCRVLYARGSHQLLLATSASGPVHLAAVLASSLKAACSTTKLSPSTCTREQACFHYHPFMLHHSPTPCALKTQQRHMGATHLERHQREALLQGPGAHPLPHRLLAGTLQGRPQQLVVAVGKRVSPA